MIAWPFIRSHLTRLSILFILFVIAIGLIVLLGWQFRIDEFTRPIPRLAAMNPLTALCFVLTGISFLILLSAGSSGKNILAGRLLAWMVIFVAVLKLAGQLFSRFIQVDEILFAGRLQDDSHTAIKSGMALNTAISFILANISLLFFDYETKRKRMPSHFFALIVFAMGFFSVLGYLYGAAEFRDLLRYLPMAVHTALCFILIALAVLFARPDKGITREFTSSWRGSFAGRLLLPAVFIIPIFLGWLRLRIGGVGSVTVELATTLLVSAIVIVFAGIIFYSIVQINKRDAVVRIKEEKFRTLLESAPDAFVIAAEDGIIQMVNAEAERMFGYPRAEMIGNKIEMLMPEKYRTIHPLHRKEYFDFPRLREMGRGLELFGKRKNGQEFFIEISLSPIHTEDGMFALAVIRDITERKMSDEKLRLSEEMFRSLVTSITDYAIYMLDADGNVITWSRGAEAIKGYRAEEIKGKHISIFYTPEDREKGLPEQFLLQAKRNGRFEQEGWRVRKDGTQFWADIVITALHDKDGKLSGFAKVTRNITEKKKVSDILTHFNEELTRQVREKTLQIEETTSQLRQLSAHLQIAREEERKKIAREIHDELGQMLIGLRMDLVWIRKNVYSRDKDTIENRFESALHLLTDTRQTMRRISTDLHPAILEDLGLVAAIELLGQQFEGRSGVQFHFVSDFTGIHDLNVTQDIAIGLYRAFQESLTNIGKHACANRIDIALTKDENNLILRISDDGIGFNPEEATGKKSLGLISLRERALMMNGRFEIHSIPGEGTTVLLTVPLN